MARARRVQAEPRHSGVSGDSSPAPPEEQVCQVPPSTLVLPAVRVPLRQPCEVSRALHGHQAQQAGKKQGGATCPIITHHRHQHFVNLSTMHCNGIITIIIMIVISITSQTSNTTKITIIIITVSFFFASPSPSPQVETTLYHLPRPTKHHIDCLDNLLANLEQDYGLNPEQVHASSSKNLKLL